MTFGQRNDDRTPGARRRKDVRLESLEDRNLLSAAGLTLPAAVVQPASHTAPLLAAGGGVVTVGQTTGDQYGPYAPVSYQGAGLASPLGLVTVSGSHNSYPTFGLGPDGQPVITGDTIRNGSLKFVTTSGDELDLSYSGSGVLVSTPTQAAEGIILFSDTYTYTVTGGTGRFAGATGSGTIHATDESPIAGLAGVPFVFDVEGTITTAGPNKH